MIFSFCPSTKHADVVTHCHTAARIFVAVVNKWRSDQDVFMGKKILNKISTTDSARMTNSRNI